MIAAAGVGIMLMRLPGSKHQCDAGERLKCCGRKEVPSLTLAKGMLEGVAAGDLDDLTGEIACVSACQKQNSVGNILWLN